MARTEGDNQEEHYLASRFGVDIPGIQEAFFTEASGLEGEMEVVETKVQDDKGQDYVLKIPGTVKYGEINLKRHLTKDKSMWEWAEQVRNGQIKDARKDGSLIMYDQAGEELGRWTFLKAWPSKWSATDLDAGSDDPLMEEVTLQIEHMSRVP